MAKSLAHYRNQLRERGLKSIVVARLRWYKRKVAGLAIFGRMVEALGNQVSVDGIKLSLDNPLIPVSDKGYILFNIHETGERALARKYILRSLPTIEIGGSIGVVSCSISRILDDPSAFVVVECSPENLKSLAKNRKLNSCEFSIEPRALAYGSDTVSFNVDSFLAGTVHGDADNHILVTTTTVLDLIKKYKFHRINLIVDCEGAEIDLVVNEAAILRDYVKWFIVEIHPGIVGRAAVSDMFDKLKESGFVVREKHGEQVVAFENVGLSVP